MSLTNLSSAGKEGIIPAVPQPSTSSSTGGSKSLYIGNLSCFVTEERLRHIFSYLGKVAECKVIKDRMTGLSAGYGFVRFEEQR